MLHGGTTKRNRNPNKIIEKYAGKTKEKPTDPKTVKEFAKGTVTNIEDPIKPNQIKEYDWVISYGYKHILTKEHINLTKNPILNLHISFLPWNKGADPNYWSWVDDTPKGVTIHAINEEIDRLRHSATSALLMRDDVIVVSSVSCIYGLGSPQEYRNKIIPIIKNKEFDLDTLLTKLIKQQYIRNDLVVSRGSFRLKGDTFDIFPVYEETIYRIEFFGDEVESILRIDPVTGEILEKLNELAILPASHYVSSDDTIKHALEKIELDMNNQIKEFEKNNKLLEAQRIKQRTMFDLEMLRELGVCS